MLQKRKKITKKQIKEDKLVTTYYQSLAFFQEHQAKFLIGIAAVALVIIAVVLFSNKRGNDNLLAAGMLSKVVPLYDQANFKDAIDGQKTASIPGLKEIVEKYGSTEEGELAKIYLANAYYSTNQFDLAAETYSDYSGSNNLLSAAAKAGIAACEEVKKEYEKAAEDYKDAAKISAANPGNANYLLRAAINYITAGKKDEAKSLLEQIKKDYPTSGLSQDVERYLAEINS